MNSLTDTQRYILQSMAQEAFILTAHAISRMKERHITIFDIVNVAETAESIKWQEKHDSYLICGKDLDGNTLFIAADLLDRNTVIITLFYADGD